VGAAGDATKSATGCRGLTGARQPAAHLPPGSRHRLSAGRRAPRLTWRVRRLHSLPQRPLRSAPAARIGRWSRAGSPDRAPLVPIRHHRSVALAQDAGDERIEFPISLNFLFLSRKCPRRCSTFSRRPSHGPRSARPSWSR
jgi:hypothetical protein